MLTPDEIVAEFERVKDPASTAQELAIQNLKHVLDVIHALGLMDKVEQARQAARDKHKPEGQLLRCTGEVLADLIRSVVQGGYFEPLNHPTLDDLEIKPGNMDPVEGIVEMYVKSDALADTCEEVVLVVGKKDRGSFNTRLETWDRKFDPGRTKAKQDRTDQNRAKEATE